MSNGIFPFYSFTEILRGLLYKKYSWLLVGLLVAWFFKTKRLKAFKIKYVSYWTF